MIRSAALALLLPSSRPRAATRLLYRHAELVSASNPETHAVFIAMTPGVAAASRLRAFA